MWWAWDFNIQDDDNLIVTNAIFNGTPLPKEYGDLIDKNEYFQGSFNDAREFLDKATTIIEANKEAENG